MILQRARPRPRTQLDGRPRRPDWAVLKQIVTLTLSVATGVLTTTAAQAATIHADGTVCTLADAIVAANTNSNTGGCAQGDIGNDTIVLDNDLTLNAADPSSTLYGGVGAGLPDVTEDLIIAAGLGSVIQRDPAFTCDSTTADPVFRFLNLESGKLTLQGLSFEQGCFLAAADSEGGGIRAAAGTELTLLGVSVSDFGAFSTVGTLDGGFVYTEGDRFTLVDGTFDGITVDAQTSLQGGLLHIDDDATATIRNTAFSNLVISSGSSMQGGAVYSRAESTIEEVDFTGIDLVSGSGVQGSGLYLSSSNLAAVRQASFRQLTTAATSSVLGGALYTSNGGTALTDTVFSDITATTDSTCTGGAIYSNVNGPFEGLIVEDVLCRSLASGAEGGAARFTSSAAVLRDCVFRRNELHAFSTARGGAIFASSLALIEQCAFVDNRVLSNVSASGRDARGGGLYAGRVDLLRNVTLAGNIAQAADGIAVSAGGGSAEGGGLYLSSGSQSSVLSAVTFTVNQAIAGQGADGFLDGQAQGGGLYAVVNHTVGVIGSILSGNTVTDAYGNVAEEDCSVDGTLTSLGFNLAQHPNPSCSFTAFADVTGLDPGLYPVADYGCDIPLPDGSCVPTAAIDQSSWAVDWSSCAETGVAEDARGLERRQDIVGVLNLSNDACDAGAFEAQDRDGDGITDVPDLCPEDADPDQSDSDGDLVGDACDACEGDDQTGDGDGDRVCDDLDQCPGFDDLADADQDNIPDDCDNCAGDNASGDADGDFVCDDRDLCPGFDDLADADLDGVPDGCDQCVGDDQSGDSDGDGLCDDLDAVVGDRVWLDDGNGIQDGGEPGVAGVTVRLYSALGALIDSTTSDSDGRYQLSPGPGDYYLEFVPLADMAFAPRNQGGDDEADSDPNVQSGTTIVFTLTAGQVDTGYDAGLEPAVIGDRVWLDDNGDGRQQPSEVGLAGVTVRLLDSSDAIAATTTTDGVGVYGFLGFPSGDYRIEVVLPTDAVFSSQDTGSDDLVDSDADPATGRSELFSYVAGSAQRRWDAGLQLLPLFADDFEQGDFTAWSSTVP